jgi:hypothetical protein
MDALWPILGGNHTDAETWQQISDAVGSALARRIEAEAVPASVVATVDAALARATARATAAEAREVKLREALKYIAWYHGEGHRVTEIAHKALETDNG